MDPFSMIPPELRSEVLLYLGNRLDIAQLIRASPTMLAQYCASKLLIRRAFLKSELTDSLLQDALAIVQFPQARESDEDSIVVRHHIEKWALAQLPDPFRQHDCTTIDILYRLYNRLSIYIHDYITKATAVFPPRAYLGLPDLSSKRRDRVFRDQKIGLEVIRLDDLSNTERKRLLGAFLRYEVLCKIYRLQPGVWVKPDTYDDLVAIQSYKLQGWEHEAVRCVHGYVEDLYGALFAQYADSWLPDMTRVQWTLLNQTISRTGLIFPNDTCFSSADYYTDMNLGIEPSISASSLALLGLDQIASLIMSPKDDHGRPRFLEPWLRGISNRYSRTFSFYAHPNHFLYQGSDMEEPEFEHWEECPGVYRELRRHIANPKDKDVPVEEPYARLQRKVYQQRAWVFFDDARCYPDQNISSHFPTRKQLMRQNRLMKRAFFAPDEIAALRRSQKWHDEYFEKFVE
ncbi:hypothetical protein FZEAL_7392 [Fusarium zealandicum]|uniref:F-box domain-containing protein n=1 Tax=Fusarium zealandicum TaxID=1053134 RepID=A0A8H4UG56_9HYPO|nr:hypothetical protein FZEAL_7392 [Fusarium zealandicum]